MSTSIFQKQARNLALKAKNMKLKISYMQALELVAFQNGFDSWNALKAKYDTKTETVEVFWNKKGIDYKSICSLIDTYGEDHDVGNAAQDLIAALDDNAFEPVPLKTKKVIAKDDDYIYYDASYFFNIKDSGSIYFKFKTQEFNDFLQSDYVKINHLIEDDAIIEFAIKTKQLDASYVRNIIEVTKVDKDDYFGI